jgi:hypothetical protein
MTGAFTTGPLTQSVPQVSNPVGFLPPSAATDLGVIWPVSILLCVASLVIRYRSADSEVRQQLRWVAFGGVIFVLAAAGAFVVDATEHSQAGWPLYLGATAIAVSAGIAALKYHLWDLDLVVRRTLVYGLLSAIVVAGYVGVVTGLGQVFDRRGIGVSLAATAVVALAIQPLRALLQRSVNRLFFGDRDSPYRALARLGLAAPSSARTTISVTAA